MLHRKSRAPCCPMQACPYCQQTFKPYRPNHKFCSVLCRSKHYEETHLVTIIPFTAKRQETTPSLVAEGVDLTKNNPSPPL